MSRLLFWAALCTAFAHTPAYASEVESPFTKVESFAEDIRDYVGGVADEAAAQAEAEALEGRRGSRSLPKLMRSSGCRTPMGARRLRGFDCSGFTRWVFSHALGRELPRTAAEQSALGTGVSLDELVPGDLLFWGSGSGVYHVGIYAAMASTFHASTGGRPRHARHLRLLRPRLRQASHRLGPAWAWSKDDSAHQRKRP